MRSTRSRGRRRRRCKADREGDSDGTGELARENIMNSDNVMQRAVKAAGTETE